MGLRAAPEEEGECDDSDDFKTCQRPLIAELLAQGELDIVGGRGKQDPQLVGESRDQSARRVCRKLVQRTGITPHAPCTPICINTAAAINRGMLQPNAQKGIITSDNASAHIIPLRRPSTCERWPKMIAPRTAPAV